MTAGTSVRRTTNASTSTPNASDNPIDFVIGLGSRMNAAKTAIMIVAAAMTTRPLWRVAGDDGLARLARVHEVLAHAGDEEDLVVHRQAEQDPDQQDRQERQHRRGLRHVEQIGEVAVLEDPDDGAHRRGDAQQEAERGLDRHVERAEHDGQQQQRQADDHDHVARQRGGELVGGVDVQRRGARHEPLDAGVLGDPVGAVAQGGDEVARLVGGGAALRRDHHDRQVALLVLDRRRTPSPRPGPSRPPRPPGRRTPAGRRGPRRARPPRRSAGR